MYSGSESRGGIDLKMLHKTDLSPIRYARICRAEGNEVPYEEIVKGYEYQPGDYVVLADKDFEKADVARTKTIDIEEFVHESELDIRYFEKPYYLEPDKGAEKAYTLLREGLSKSNKIAIAKFVLRNRESLAAIKPVGHGLVLEKMYFPSDLRSPTELKLPGDEKVQKKELDVALKLIDHLTEPFIAEDFHDTYTEELQDIIDAKVKGERPRVKSAAPKTTESKDLMAMLKASLEKERDKTAAK
jgi:DNA end-binding protein Ku